MKRSRIDSIFVLLVFCVFTGSVLLTLALSAGMYQQMTAISSTGRNDRIALSYVRTRVRSIDNGNQVSVGTFNGISSLEIREYFFGRYFVTYIYLFEGWVRELFHEEGEIFTPGAGTPIIESNKLEFEQLENGLVRIVTGYRSAVVFPRQ